MHGPLTLTAGVVAAVLGFSVMWTGADLIAPAPIQLDVTEVVYFENGGEGFIRQRIDSIGGQPVAGEWSVTVTRDSGGVSRTICRGSGNAVYSGEQVVMPLDEWSGDPNCPPALRPGDVAEAAWSYVNEHSVRVSIGTTIRVE